jgi:hypothetical protein
LLKITTKCYIFCLASPEAGDNPYRFVLNQHCSKTTGQMFFCKHLQPT